MKIKSKGIRMGIHTLLVTLMISLLVLAVSGTEVLASEAETSEGSAAVSEPEISEGSAAAVEETTVSEAETSEETAVSEGATISEETVAVPVGINATAAMINSMYEGRFSESQLRMPQAVSASESETVVVEELLALIRDGLAARDNEISFELVLTEQLDLDVIELLIYAAMEPYDGAPSYVGDALYADFLYAEITGSGYVDSDGIYYITYVITPEYCTTAEQEMALRSAITSTINSLNLSGVSDYEKIRKIYDYICSNVTYDYTNLNNNAYTLKYTAYAAMFNKTAVCEGYSCLLYRMCIEAGIPCRMITGTSEGEAHAWNIVRVDGRYYNVDATWDSGDRGTVYYDYFLKCDADFPMHVCDDYYTDSEFVGEHVKSGVSYGGLTTYLGNYVYVTSGVIDSSVDSPILIDGRWYYMVDGVCDGGFTGLVKDGDVWYSFVNGLCDTTYSRLTNHDGTYYHIENGVVAWDYTGLSAGELGWCYVENGVANWDYTGLVDYGGNTFYVINGRMDPSVTGLYRINGVWYKIFNATVDKYYTGLCKNEDNGLWFYITEGIVDWNFTGLTKYNGLWFYVANGMLDWNFTGFCKNQGIWFYVKGGMVDWNFTGLAKFNGIWFYAENGMINWNYTGLCKNNGIWFYVNGGMVDWSFTGVTKYNGIWFYVDGGMLNWNYIGLCMNNGVLYYVDGGMIDWNYTGIVEYEGEEYEVVGGYVR